MTPDSWGHGSGQFQNGESSMPIAAMEKAATAPLLAAENLFYFFATIPPAAAGRLCIHHLPLRSAIHSYFKQIETEPDAKVASLLLFLVMHDAK